MLALHYLVDMVPFVNYGSISCNLFNPSQSSNPTGCQDYFLRNFKSKSKRLQKLTKIQIYTDYFFDAILAAKKVRKRSTARLNCVGFGVVLIR